MKVLIILFSLGIIATAAPPCHFATEQITHKELFSQYCLYESRFIHELAMDSTGIAINDITINDRTGIPEIDMQSEKISNFAIEAIHLALIAKVLQEAENAELFYSKTDALELLDQKIEVYLKVLRANQFRTKIGENLNFKTEGQENIYWSVLVLNKVLQKEYKEHSQLLKKWLAFQRQLEEMNLDLKIKFCKESTFFENDDIQFYCQWIHLFLPSSYYATSFKDKDVQLLKRINQIDKFDLYPKDFFTPRSLMTILSLEFEEKELAWDWLRLVLGRTGGQSKFGAVSEGACLENHCVLRWQDKVAPIIAMMGGLRDLIEIEVKELFDMQELFINEPKYTFKLSIPAPKISPPSFRRGFFSCEEPIFPPDFFWGASTSSYQIEGGWNEDGKGEGILDKFYHYWFQPSYFNGDKALNFYHDYLSQIEEMSKLGINGLRISISWPRILPNGTPDVVNMKGIKYYQDVLKAIIAKGMEPQVTLYHFDLPQKLEDQEGWLNERSSTWFEQYADVCFKHFGHLVKYWATINEPVQMALLGYGEGAAAPGRCEGQSIWNSSISCSEMGGIGNFSTDPYIAVRNQLLAHAKAVAVYRKHYQTSQKGKIGFVSDITWPVPYNYSNWEDIAAAERHLEFNAGWQFDPVVKGDYPSIMKSLIGPERLKPFTVEERDLLRNSYDFLGLNYYSIIYVESVDMVGTNHSTDGRYKTHSVNIDGCRAGDKEGWQIENPKGLKNVLYWMDQRYQHPEIIILETGMSFNRDNIQGDLDLSRIIDDKNRTEYLQEHTIAAYESIQEGIDLKGFFVWSAIDTFIFARAYDKLWGLIYADFESEEEVIPLSIKKSGIWYRKWIDYQKSKSGQRKLK